MNILFTGGGTGGHLSVVRNVAEEVKAIGGNKLYYIGSIKGQDKKWFENNSLFDETYFFDTQGVVNKDVVSVSKSLWRHVKASYGAIKIMRAFNIHRVFSVGGYSAAPASMAAIWAKIPLFIHEQNAHIGLLNAILKPFAQEFYSSYTHQSPVKEYPIKEDFFVTRHLREHVKNILILGGSQGARALNDFALNIALEFQKRNIHIIHQCGERDLERVQSAYKSINIEAEVFGFVPNILPYVQRADFALSRSGASSLWELSANALPALFVPYPYAAKNHQYHNAEFLVRFNLAYLCEEHALNASKVFNIIDQSLIKECSSRLLAHIKSGGARAIAERILNVHVNYKGKKYEN